MTLNSGGMEDFSRYLGVNRTLAVIYCIVSVFLQADGNSISQTAGSTVTLQCSNMSINHFVQVAWAKDGDNLFSFMPQRTSNSSQKTSDSKWIQSLAAASLKVNMSTSESQLYALIIESAQKTHTGNYTCETTTDSGVFEQKWELLITDPHKNYVAAVVAVPCFLIFIITALIILRGVRKRRSQNLTQPPRRLQQQREPVYENLEIESHQRSVKIQIHPYKYRAE
ncbi:uncharacterized protein LOC115801211 isoform X2 [Archocentrus centrarchus]|uniref:uncharacterized protein LOC115801211 isoform X2 n=1 Tax=Archocentrus centrarchus TaxID=63155 RepID=UPI0011EA459C|nr:uncharacterized protein LOC115801211 isoform X2 [Archocentrus centrarchus]